MFGNANLSNLSGSLLEGNKDHLLSPARSDLSKRELHVESANKCIGDLLETNGGAKQGTAKTNLLNLVMNKLDCKRNCYEKPKLFEIRRFEASTKWENEETEYNKLMSSRCNN